MSDYELIDRIESVPKGDRWRIHHRFQELHIPSWCAEDGHLWVALQHGVQAVLIRSTLQQFTSSRQELLHWLERCWALSYQ